MIVSTPNSPTTQTAKRLHDPTLSSRAFAIFFVITILIAIMLLVAPKAGAANDLYWDTNGTSTGSGAATGTWGTNNLWNSDSNGVTNTFTTTTNNTNDVHFSAGTNGGNGTVTINLAQSANSIMFEEGVITLSGGTSITLGGGGGVNSGLLFVSGTGANTISTALVLGSAAAFTNNDNSLQTISGGITGGFNLTINGTGTGDFTFSTGSVNNGGSITNSGTRTGMTTISSVIGSNVTSVTENSATSNLILSGVNQYTGGTTVTAGTLQLSGSGTLGSTTGTLTVNGGTLDLNSTSQTVGALNGSGGTITTTGSAAASLTVGNGGASGSYSGTITDPNNGSKHLSLTKTGAGTQTLSGNNTYTGGTNINGGILSLGSAGAIATTGTISFGGGTLQYSASNTTDYSSRFSNAASQQYSIDTNGQAATFGTALTSSSGTFTKLGAGTLTLNAANTYSGLTTVSAGTLAEGVSNAIGTGGLTINGSTAVFGLGANHTDSVGTVTLDGGGSITGTGTSALTSTGTFDMRSGSASAILAGSVALNKTTAGTVTLTGANTYTGATTITAGTLSVSSLANGGVTSNIGQSTNAAANLVFDGGTLQYTGGSISTDRNFTINSSKTATIDVSTAATNLTISGASTATNGALTKIGAGTLILTGNNTYSGGTTVSAGTLLANNATASTGSGAVVVNNTGTLGGSGKITGGVTVSASGTINPGSVAGARRATAGSVATLNIGALTMTGGTAAFDFATVSSVDKIVSAGAVDLGSNVAQLNVLIASGLNFAASTNYVLIDGSTITGTFNGYADNTEHNFDGYEFVVHYNLGGDGNFELTAVPEPSTWIGAALTLGAIGFMQRRRFARAIARR